MQRGTTQKGLVNVPFYFFGICFTSPSAISVGDEISSRVGWCFFFPDIYQPLLLMLDLIDSQQWVGLSDYYHSWLFHDLYPCKRWNRYILPTDIPGATVHFAFKSPDRRRDRSPRWGPCATCPCRCHGAMALAGMGAEVGWSFPKLGVPPKKMGVFDIWKIMENPIHMDDWEGYPPFMESCKWKYPQVIQSFFHYKSSYWGSPILGHPHMGKWWFSSGFWQSLSATSTTEILRVDHPTWGFFQV